MSHTKNGILKLSNHTLVKIEKHRQVAGKILDFITPEIDRIAEIIDEIHSTLHIRDRVKSIISLNAKDIIEIAGRVYSLISPNYIQLFEMASKIQAMIPNNKKELEKTLQELVLESLKDLSNESSKNIISKNSYKK